MIRKQELHCNEKGIAVEALVQVRKARGKAKAGGQVDPINCTNAGKCDKNTFCRFVNPLTTRNPLQVGETSEAPSA